MSSLPLVIQLFSRKKTTISVVYISRAVHHYNHRVFLLLYAVKRSLFFVFNMSLKGNIYLYFSMCVSIVFWKIILFKCINTVIVIGAVVFFAFFLGSFEHTRGQFMPYKNTQNKLLHIVDSKNVNIISPFLRNCFPNYTLLTNCAVCSLHMGEHPSSSWMWKK